MAVIRIKSIRGGDDTRIEGVDLSMTVSAFKDLVEQKMGTQKASQRIIFQGRVLTDDQTLTAAGLTDDAQVHMVVISAAPAQRSAPVQPATNTPSRGPNLFAPGGNSGRSSGGSQGMAPPGLGDLEGVPQFLQSPQGQQLLRMMLENPEAVMQQIPELRQSPEFAAAIQQLAANPQALQMLQEEAMRISRPARPLPRDIFDVAMDVLNGAPLPAEYQLDRRGGRGARPRSAPQQRPEDPHHEFITRAQIDAALDACIVMIPSQPGAGPDTSATDAMETATEPASDVATQGSTDTAMEVEQLEAGSEAGTGDQSTPAPAVAGGQSSSEMPSTTSTSQYSAQLEQLRAMGFTDDSLSLQALEAAGGEVMTAIAFLTEN